MKNIIKWFVLLMHKDMQNFEMNCILQRMDVHMLKRENRNIPPVHL